MHAVVDAGEGEAGVPDGRVDVCGARDVGVPEAVVEVAADEGDDGRGEELEDVDLAVGGRDGARRRCDEGLREDGDGVVRFTEGGGFVGA